MKKNILCVGAGFSGAVIARELAEAGYKVTVIDKRGHIAGNAYDYVNDIGIRVHKYGPHLWHTNNEEAHKWFGKFTEFVPYKHVVRALLENGKTTPLPINLNTLRDIFGNEAVNEPLLRIIDGRKNSIEQLNIADLFLDSIKTPLDSEPKNSREHIESSVGKKLTELFFAPYTKKMWGMDLSELPVSVAARIPTKNDQDPYYFPNDKFQGMPVDGYTKAFEKMFDHENITVILNTYREEYLKASGIKFDHIFTAEPIDEYYNFQFGELPWRSIKFNTINLDLPECLDAPTVNFTHDGPYTRVTEWKKIAGHGTNAYQTTLTFEEPCDYKDNNNERYYPVKSANFVDNNREIYKKYREFAKNNKDVTHVGRCGGYVYADMHMVIQSTLTVVQKFIKLKAQ